MYLIMQRTQKRLPYTESGTSFLHLSISWCPRNIQDCQHCAKNLISCKISHHHRSTIKSMIKRHSRQGYMTSKIVTACHQALSPLNQYIYSPLERDRHDHENVPERLFSIQAFIHVCHNDTSASIAQHRAYAH
ncbi:uncharacterized protein BO97DRAFT_239464 [Aspergillus homomorphus CBS 101889]|uniref:Uncharacterized protein n=1 Tax=Aspergillus homomorphus (strain CBS 101889) TaxID=1450537 RepID=A0A395I5S1_ASPHC|nr:hypothetical protein BO97DRAFT_239464 [Aspergillus homomorphus CBS 101889]RAL15099.1 hypothetical protein BO97DRAFT_239464 [Aspergillus homomorphus CBS 101889]